MVTFNFHLDVPFKRDPESQEKIQALKKAGKTISKGLLSEKETAIYLIVTLPKGLVSVKAAKIIKIHAKEKIYPRHWDFGSKMPNSHAPDTIELTDRLDDFKTKIKKAYKAYADRCKVFVYDKLKAELEAAAAPGYVTVSENNFYTVWADHLKLNPKIKSARTRAKFDGYEKLLKEFESEKKYVITFDTINAEFIALYTKYLQEEKKNYKSGEIGILNNTLHKYLSDLKSFLRWSFEEGYHKNTYFAKISPGKDETEPVSLEYEEFQQLFTFIPDEIELEKTKDKYISQILTGQRLEDIQKISWTDIKGDVWRLFQAKGRRGRVLEIPLHAIVINIFNKYIGTEAPLPVMTDQDYNDNIKKLCEKAGITSVYSRMRYVGDKPVKETGPKSEFMSSHSARKTFINVAAEIGIPIEVVMSITGSKDYKVIMEHYRRVKLKQKQSEIGKFDFIESKLKVAK